MKTIAQQLNIKDFPFEIRDKQGNEIYREDSDGYWRKSEYDSENREVFYKDSRGFWWKREYNSKCNIIYMENSRGEIIDNRPKERATTITNEIPVCYFTNDELKDVITINGIKYKKTDD